MNVAIYSRGFSLTRALEDYVKEHIKLVLGRFSGRVDRVTVTLSDINGPRGGVDKRCQVQAKIGKLGTVLVQDTHSDLYAAISNSSARLRRTVARKLDQRAKRSRGFIEQQAWA